MLVVKSEGFGARNHEIIGMSTGSVKPTGIRTIVSGLSPEHEMTFYLTSPMVSSFSGCARFTIPDIVTRDEGSVIEDDTTDAWLLDINDVFDAKWITLAPRSWL